MFERFTDQARRVLVLTQEEARTLNHNYIGTEHILLGLIHEGQGVAAKVFDSLGVTIEAARRKVEESVGPGKGRPSGHIPFTPQAKQALERSLREAIKVGDNFVDTQHLLLGLLGTGDSAAAKVLVGLGVEIDRVRQQVAELMRGQVGEVARASASSGLKAEGRQPAETVVRRIESLDVRLTALERWVGVAPDLRDLDQEIAEVRRAKETAIDEQEFETAAALRDRERALIIARDTRVKQFAPGPSAAEELAQLRAELDRLRGILRAHGIESGDDAA